MQTVTDILTGVVSEAFFSRGFERDLGAVMISSRPDLCHYQCNGAFAGAKLHRKSPLEIASGVAELLAENRIFESAQAMAPGFINLTLSDSYIIELAREMEASGPVPAAESPLTIVLDYGGPNIAKPLHIGHLRSAIIGESLKRICLAAGHKVKADVHLGDWGLQIGLVICELMEQHPDWPCFKEGFDPERDPLPVIPDADALVEIYPRASAKSREDAGFKERARGVTALLQSGEPGYIALWREIRRVSVEDIRANYGKLFVSFDLWNGESDAEPFVPELIDILTEQGLLYESGGAMVVDVEKEDDRAPMPPVIVKKSDNSSIYATTDLATIIGRQREYDPDRIWYCADSRQSLHFEQVFRCSKKAGLIKESCELAFLGFGTMNGKDGKPYKTRDGGVMRLSDLISEVTCAAREKLESSSYVSEEDLLDAALKVGVAALKFGDLSNQPSRDYVFDMEKFLSFEGKTGVYLLYMVARINSILKKYGDTSGCSLKNIEAPSERELFLRLLAFPNYFTRALTEKAPSCICEAAYETAAAFSSFYHEVNILKEEDAARKGSLIALCALTKKVLTLSLHLLGIEPVENM